MNCGSWLRTVDWSRQHLQREEQILLNNPNILTQWSSTNKLLIEWNVIGAMYWTARLKRTDSRIVLQEKAITLEPGEIVTKELKDYTMVWPINNLLYQQEIDIRLISITILVHELWLVICKNTNNLPRKGFGSLLHCCRFELTPGRSPWQPAGQHLEFIKQNKLQLVRIKQLFSWDV